MLPRPMEDPQDNNIVAFYVIKDTAVEKQGNLLSRAVKLAAIVFMTLGLFLYALQMVQPRFGEKLFSGITGNGVNTKARQAWLKNSTITTEPGSEVPGALWGTWSAWSKCSRQKFCQEGTQHRKRKCLSFDSISQCVGVSMEARDCPEGLCVRSYNLPSLVDKSPAPSTSFIAQECNSSTRYSAKGKYHEWIPDAVFRLFPPAKRMLTSGFFAVQVIPKVLPEEHTIIKVCFEPYGQWSLSAARKVFHLNRATKASLGDLKSDNLVGLAISLKRDGSLYGALVAAGSPGGFYSYVFYKRFRGRSFSKDLTF